MSSALCPLPPSAFCLPSTSDCSFLRPKGSLCQTSPVNSTGSTLKARRKSADHKLSTGWQKCVCPQTCNQNCCYFWPALLEHFHGRSMPCCCYFVWSLLSFHISSLVQNWYVANLTCATLYFNSQEEGCKLEWMFGSVGPALNCWLVKKKTWKSACKAEFNDNELLYGFIDANVCVCIKYSV